MTTLLFNPGVIVITPDSSGIVIDVRTTPVGSWIYGVEDDAGRVSYFTSKALRLATT